MTRASTRCRRIRSFWLDRQYLIEPSGSDYARKGMTKEQMRHLQELQTGRRWMSEWQPIETAPKDKAVLLGWKESGQVKKGWYRNNAGPRAAKWFADGFVCLTPPTHWRPLPQPPSAT